MNFDVVMEPFVMVVHVNSDRAADGFIIAVSGAGVKVNLVLAGTTTTISTTD